MSIKASPRRDIRPIPGGPGGPNRRRQEAWQTKRLILVCLFVTFIIPAMTLSAEAPELKNVMPNKWKSLTRVSGAEETSIKRQLNYSIKEWIKDNLNYCGVDEYEKEIWPADSKTDTYIYRQTINNTNFFYFITTKNGSNNFNSIETNFIQELYIYKDGKYILLAASMYNVREIIDGYYMSFTSIDVIERENGLFGIMLSKAMLKAGIITENIYSILNKAKYKDQIRCYSSACIIFMEDLINYRTITNLSPFEEIGTGAISIEIAVRENTCLLDQSSPMRHGIQNAFDNNPETCYIENSESDLFELDITFNMKREFLITDISFINGYAQTGNLYLLNNRAREIVIDYIKISRDETIKNTHILQLFRLNDNTLSHQSFPIQEKINVFKEPAMDTFLNIRCTGFFPGSKNNNTCIAEININTDIYGWLFGKTNVR